MKYKAGLVIGTFAYVFGVVTVLLDVRFGYYQSIPIATFGVFCGIIGLAMYYKLIVEYLDEVEPK